MAVNTGVLLTFVLMFAAAAFAQPRGYEEITTVRELPGMPLSCWASDGTYDAERLAALQQKPNCEKTRDIAVDFSREMLVHWSAASDCHMRVWVKVFRVDAEKQFRIILNNIYGGCRAGGWRNGFLVFEKPPQGWTVNFTEVDVDHQWDKKEYKFRFPEPTVSDKP